MTQAELNEAVAARTGESLRTIRRRGFSIIEPLHVLDAQDQQAADPQIVDWDALQTTRQRQAA